MKRKIFVLTILLFLIISPLVFAEEGKVYVIPVNSEITNASSGFIKKSIAKAEENKADLIIFEIDTYGGSVLAAEKIKNYIVDSKVKTAAFVNTKAESAGVLITIACEKVYMAPTATIGSAETIPKTEKNISFWRSILRDTAQYRNRNSEIIEAMADSDIKIPNLSSKGKLVNLTSEESLKYKISDGTVRSYKDIAEDLNLNDDEIINLEMDSSYKFINIISSSGVSTLLLVLGLTGFIFEIFTPGFGLGGVISILSFFFFFLGSIFSGNSNWYSVMIFLLGLLLLIIEMFIPGFGLAGISGIIAVVCGLVMALGSIDVAVRSLSIAFVIAFIFGMALVKSGMKSRLFNRLRLEKSHTSERGYIGKENPDLKIGDFAVTRSILRPVGYIEFNGKKYEAIAYEGYIESGVNVEVCRIDSGEVYVRRVN
ncbi:NfeD family protein [Peptoniphilus catoniae]|uniref:NfeD family protein n=1 Tax=Peptoniphilus catoniae TaxID=1660341 RepID=UPI0010FE66D2|nr:NfeD family protein [Peptoniphilus catoniae]